MIARIYFVTKEALDFEDTPFELSEKIHKNY